MAMGADYSFELIFSETCAPQFNGHNNSFLARVNNDYKHDMNAYRLEEQELLDLWASFLIMDATHGQPFLSLPHSIAHLEEIMMD